MYITITGSDYYMGIDAYRVNQILTLKKDKDNFHDDEAIKVISDNNVTYGYVANSIKTKARGCNSAGFIYNMFDDLAKCKVLFITDSIVIAEVLL